jgi:phenylpyruvate tautomerase PptA (4-oxalocrotonate tautomerase family)
MPDPLTKAQKYAIREQMSEAIHTAFRKGSDHPSAHQIWVLIKEMPDKEWSSIIDFINTGLRLK